MKASQHSLKMFNLLYTCTNLLAVIMWLLRLAFLSWCWPNITSLAPHIGSLPSCSPVRTIYTQDRQSSHHETGKILRGMLSFHQLISLSLGVLYSATVCTLYCFFMLYFVSLVSLHNVIKCFFIQLNLKYCMQMLLITVKQCKKHITHITVHINKCYALYSFKDYLI